MGMLVGQVVEFYNAVLDQDYVEIYKRTSIGPKMKEVDAALAEQKQALVNSTVTFGNLPTGIDNSPLKGEYNYKNNETMMSLTRQGVTRYFFQRSALEVLRCHAAQERGRCRSPATWAPRTRMRLAS